MNPVFLTPVNVFADNASWPEPRWYQAPLSRQLSMTEREKAVAASRLRFSRYQAFSTVLAAAAVNLLTPYFKAQPRGILALAGSTGLDVSWAMLERITSGKPDLINPIMFPATLDSGCPSAIAALFDAHAFALSLNANRDAFVHALYVARLMLFNGDASEIILVSALDGGPTLTRACNEADRAQPASSGIAFLVEASLPQRTCIRLTWSGAPSDAGRAPHADLPDSAIRLKSNDWISVEMVDAIKFLAVLRTNPTVHIRPSGYARELIVAETVIVPASDNTHRDDESGECGAHST
ncbi:hypothetical protein VOI32_00845 [Paraburkholderia caribensis]|uniref:Uncharacterized protein n=1 Tax=Paraburkholderia caribensis TaxID=75105 RepID=A0A9Q6WL24_9BURK|nr:hypothetical protein [Paraburkholderia caribensis]MCO4875576.1 hypothetical protein [Paraburkholderia caribensis]PTB30505.1 hypothetical protein C9I56_01795 [Paraburkholderia caribensis]QLB62254.1 hypothetical protein A9O66_07590 [Paraburkholderia caribensis]